MAQTILYFMSVGVSVTPIPDQSFEELRVRDYLTAYQATGRLPQPCPQSPDTQEARAALGIPPLFVPTAIPVPSETASGMSSAGDDAPATHTSHLPATHEFRPTKAMLGGDQFECISAQTLYSHFSHEELRCYAYLAGNKMSVGNTMEGASSSSSASTLPPSQFYARDARTTAYMTSTAVPGTPDYLFSIVASPKFDKHSFEELRMAYLLAGKEVGSSEIPSRGGLPAQPAPTLFGRPRGDAFSSGSLKLF